MISLQIYLGVLLFDYKMENIENSVDFSVSNEEIIIGDYIEIIASAPQEYNLQAYTIELLENEDAKICSICLDVLQNGDIANRLLCGHVFHENCILRWLDITSNCPYCRSDVPKNQSYSNDETDPLLETTDLNDSNSSEMMDFISNGIFSEINYFDSFLDSVEGPQFLEDFQNYDSSSPYHF